MFCVLIAVDKEAISILHLFQITYQLFVSYVCIIIQGFGKCNTFLQKNEEKREKIHTTDIDEYFIAQVHGIKGEARGIGAERLGNLFEELEETAKQGNSRQVEELLPEAMQEWERIVRLIQTVLS